MSEFNEIVDQTLLTEIIGDDAELLASVIELFKDQTQTVLAELDTALKHGDSDRLARAAHDLKNVGRAVAARELVEHSQQLEQLGAGAQLRAAAGALSKTRRLLSKILSELEHIRRQ